MRYKIFGCKVNKYYTDEWLNSDYLKDKEGVFIASCVVTDKAKKKWVTFLKQELTKLKTWEKIFLTGCGALEKWETNQKFFEVYADLNPYKDQIELLSESPRQNKKDWKSRLSTLPIKSLPSVYTKKFIVIQWGCDSFCSFCLTLQKRGKHFYRPWDDLISEINDFHQAWGKELVLTWVNLCAWGLESTNDFKDSRFDEILTRILSETSISRIRISSLGPEFINDRVLEVLKDPRILPHFHVSIQSGSSRVLDIMRRHYDGVYLRNLLLKLKRLKENVSIWADLIVWFPSETEEDFLQTLDLVENFGITKLHAFPFSNHKYAERVPASYYPNQVEETAKKERFQRLSELWDQKRNEFIESLRGKKLFVLIEKVQWEQFSGWSENYIECTHDNFVITEGIIKRNEIITGYLK